MARNCYASLVSSGMTNHDQEDWGTLATASRKIYYNYFCSSWTCAGSNNKGKKVIEHTDVWHEKCPNCGQRLHSKRSTNN